MDEIAIPAYVAFSDLSCSLGNEAFGCLVRAALWRASHGWERPDGELEYWIPRAVAHTIAPVEVWDRIAKARACIEYSVDSEISGYLLTIPWPVVTYQEQNCDYKFHYPAERPASKKTAPKDVYGLDVEVAK